MELVTLFKVIVSFIAIEGHGYAVSDTSYATLMECEASIPIWEDMLRAEFHGRIEVNSECVEDKPGRGII